MTTDRPWDAPTYGEGGGGSGGGRVSAGGNAGYGTPGHAAAGYGVPNAGQGYAAGPAGPGPWGLPTARSLDPGRVPCIIAAALFGVDGVLNLTALFGPDHAWKNPVTLVIIALLTLGCVLAAVLLVPQRTRGLGVGLAIGQALTETARFVFSVEPSAISHWNLVESLSNLGTYIATALAGIVVAIAMVRERRFAPRGGRQPLPVLVLGIPGTLLIVLGLLFDDYRLVYGSADAGGSFSYPCCGWSSTDAFGKTSYVLTPLALIACVLLAALVARIGFSKGLLAGVGLFLLTEAAIALITVLAPKQAAYGFGEPGEAISAHPKVGLWFTLAGTALFVIAFFVHRSGVGSSGVGSGGPADAIGQYGMTPGYPAQPGYAAAPGYPQQAGFGQPSWQQQPGQMQPPPQMPQQPGSWRQPQNAQNAQPQNAQSRQPQQPSPPPPPFGQSSSWPPAPPPPPPA